MSSILQRLLSQLHFWFLSGGGEGYCKGQNSFVLRREGFVDHRVLLTGSFSIV